MQNDKSVYPISMAAKLLKVHPRTLSLYEHCGFIGLKRRAKKRFFPNNDLRWILCISKMIHGKGARL